MKHPIDRLVEQARPDDYYQAPDPTRRDWILARARTEPGQPTRARAVLRRRLGLVAVGLATAVVVTVALLPQQTSGPDDDHAATTPTGNVPESPTPRAAVVRDVLFQAAGAAAQVTPPSTARYWHHRALAIDVELDAPGKVLLEQRRSTDLWLPRNPAGSSWSITQPLGARSLSGGGTSWKVRVGAPCPRPGMPTPCWTTKKVTSAPARPERLQHQTGAKPFAIANTNVSVEELRLLPTDPTRLRAKLLELANPRPADQNAVLFQVTSTLVSRLPTTPAVRAAGYRVLAGISGVRLLSEVTDALGRSGTAVSRRSGADEERLVFDQRTGRPLAYEVRVVRPGPAHPGMPAGTRVLAEVVETMEWTSAGPPAM